MKTALVLALLAATPALADPVNILCIGGDNDFRVEFKLDGSAGFGPIVNGQMHGGILVVTDKPKRQATTYKAEWSDEEAGLIVGTLPGNEYFAGRVQHAVVFRYSPNGLSVLAVGGQVAYPFCQTE